jgi:hypothetical protein
MTHSGVSLHESCTELMSCFRLVSYVVTRCSRRHVRSHHLFVNFHDVFIECELGVLS